MSFEEIRFDPPPSEKLNLSEAKLAVQTSQKDRNLLAKNIESRWETIPSEAIHLVAMKCPDPKLMPNLLSELSRLGHDDPYLLTDPDICSVIIDDLIANAQQVEKVTEIVNLNEKQSVLVAINKATSNLTGRAKLKAAREYFNTTNVSEEIRSELMARFDQIENALNEMSAVLADPASQSEFNQIVNSTAFDLESADLALTFAPIIEKVEASETFTAEQKYKLREIVTGSAAQSSLAETIIDQRGKTVPRYTFNNKRDFRQGVSGYIEGQGRQIIEAQAGDRMVTKDVTGWSGEEVGLLIEMSHMWAVYDSFGVTGFIEDVYKTDFSILADGNAFDPIQIMHLRQMLSHLTGNFEGYDGDIANLSEHKTLIQNQARLLSDTQTAFGWESDPSGTTKTLQRLGLEDEQGRPNMDAIKAFGDYSKQHYAGEVDQNGLLKYLQSVRV